MNKEKMIEWIATHRVGTSSKTMWAALMGVKPENSYDIIFYDVPYDADDFSRCCDLVNFCEITPAYDFPKITAIFPWYDPILARWETLALLYERKQWDKFREIIDKAVDESREIRDNQKY